MSDGNSFKTSWRIHWDLNLKKKTGTQANKRS